MLVGRIVCKQVLGPIRRRIRFGGTSGTYLRFVRLGAGWRHHASWPLFLKPNSYGGIPGACAVIAVAQFRGTFGLIAATLLCLGSL